MYLNYTWSSSAKLFLWFLSHSTHTLTLTPDEEYPLSICKVANMKKLKRQSRLGSDRISLGNLGGKTSVDPTVLHLHSGLHVLILRYPSWLSIGMEKTVGRNDADSYLLWQMFVVTTLRLYVFSSGIREMVLISEWRLYVSTLLLPSRIDGDCGILMQPLPYGLWFVNIMAWNFISSY